MKAFYGTAVVIIVGGLFCLAAWSADKAPARDDAKDAELPPHVVSAEPADRSVDVDPGLTEIRVTFDRRMMIGRNYAWVILDQYGTYPGYKGSPAPRWEADGKTCVLPVRLQPETVYAVGINSHDMVSFKDSGGVPAMPTSLVFKTAK